MARKPKTTERTAVSDEARYFELVNWTRAQPTIPEKDAPWVKLYTSLLDNDAFGAMDDSARMLIVSLWLYAGRSGRYVFPVDPKWLRKKIPMLNQEPDLTPLLEARDAYGEPRPFIRIVDKTGIYNIHNSTEKEKREKRQENKTKPSRASEQKEKKEKRRVSSPPKVAQAKESREENQAQEKTADPPLTQTAEQTRPKPVNPSNPKKSEAGGAVCVHTPKPPHFALDRMPRPMGKIPIWWSDPACTAFSYAVFDALGLRVDPEGEEGKSQRGVFASWLFEARAQTPTHQWRWLEDEAIAKAKEIARYGKSARKPGAVWCSVMAKVIQSRAGPAAASG